MSTTYQGASSAHFHPTRKTARALRQGDRVKDRFHAPFDGLLAPYIHSYPGSHAYGTVIAGPKFFGGTLLVQVRFDDGFEGWLIPPDLTRL